MGEPRVHVLALAREEIRALPRQTFALGAVTVLLFVLAPLAAVSLEGPSGMRDFLTFLWVVAELAVGIALAARVAAARRTRFVESLYTTPLEARTWLGAQVVVGLFLATLVIVAQLPFLLLHVALVGVPAGLAEVFLATLGVAAFAVAFGLFCGVVVGDAGPGAAAGLAGGVSFVSFILLILHGTMAGPGPTSLMQEVILRAAALSPLALAFQICGIDVFGIEPVELWRPLVGFVALVGGFAAAAWIAYTRGQGPLGWEGGPARIVVAGLVALALVTPVATAELDFREMPDDDDFEFSPGESTRIAFVPRGAPITDHDFTLEAYFDREPLAQGADAELDALVMLVVPQGASVRAVRIQAAGSDSLLLVGGGAVASADGTPAGRARMTEGFEDEPDAAAPLRPVYRVPLTLRPVDPVSLTGSPGLLVIDTTYVVDGRAQTSQARLTIDADVPGASAMLLAAGAPLPLAALGSLVARRIRTR